MGDTNITLKISRTKSMKILSMISDILIMKKLTKSINLAQNKINQLIPKTILFYSMLYLQRKLLIRP